MAVQTRSTPKKTDKKPETDSKGIPLKHSHPAGDTPLPVFYAIFQSVVLSICMSIAYFFIYPQFKDAADKKIAILGSLSLGWVYFSAFVLRLGATVNGVRLGMTRLQSKVDVPDQHVYKVMGASGSSLGYVLMETEGEHGAFNRAQRAVQNYNEQYPQFMLYFLLSSFVFPFPTFCLVCGWAVSKIISAFGYVSAPKSRMPGTMLSLLCGGTVEALVLLSGYLAIQAQ